jgi:heme exporter protein D
MLYQLHAGFETARNARQLATPPEDRLALAMRPTVGRNVAGQFNGLVTVVSLCGVLLSVVVFAVFPRDIGRGVVADVPGPSAPRQVGFSEEIDLLRGGRITLSRDEMLSVTILDAQGQPTSVDGPLRLRGIVLDRYLGRGLWVSSEGPVVRLETDPGAEQWILPLAVAPDTVTQQIVCRRRENVMFSLATPVAVGADQSMRVMYSGMSQTLGQTGSRPTRAYTVQSAPVLSQEDASKLIEAPAPVNAAQQFDHPKVHVLAINILRDAGLPPLPPPDAEQRWQWNMAAANAFCEYLQRGGYHYTLDLGNVFAPLNDSDFDPVVQFLTETRRGHCEYFASGFTALCHSVDVPARIVAGYLAYQYDPIDQCYRVLASNAHAWAEVRTGLHQWTAFDATPAAILRDLQQAPSTLADRMRWAYQRLEDAWGGAVVRFDFQHQRNIIDSVDRDFSGHFVTLVNRVSAWMDRVNQAFRLGPAGYIWMGIVGLAIVVAVIALVKLVRRSLAIRRTLRLQDVTGREARRMLRQLGFYLDMLRVLEKAGLAKPASRPPLSYADEVGDQHPVAAALVRELTELFYAARFGGRRLSADGIAKAGASVRRLATTLEVRL